MGKAVLFCNSLLLVVYCKQQKKEGKNEKQKESDTLSDYTGSSYCH